MAARTSDGILRWRIKKHPAVESLFSEFGNLGPDEIDWWIHLKPGYGIDETHSIHEQTLQECWDVLEYVEKCTCGCAEREP